LFRLFVFVCRGVNGKSAFVVFFVSRLDRKRENEQTTQTNPVVR